MFFLIIHTDKHLHLKYKVWWRMKAKVIYEKEIVYMFSCQMQSSQMVIVFFCRDTLFSSSLHKRFRVMIIYVLIVVHRVHFFFLLFLYIFIMFWYIETVWVRFNCLNVKQWKWMLAFMYVVFYMVVSSVRVVWPGYYDSC